MSYCCRCGVELAEGTPVCPLCQTPVPIFSDREPQEPAYPPSSGPSKVFFTGKQLRLRIFLVLTGFLMLPTLIVALVDYFGTGAITWSRQPISVLAGTFVFLVCGFLLWKKPAWMAAGFGIAGALLLGLLNWSLDGRLTWSLGLGLPLIAWLAVLTALCALIFIKIRRLGYNLFGILSWAVSAFCLGLDFLIGEVFQCKVLLSWSLIVTLALVPLGCFFFLLHYALGRNINLKQTFHI